MSRLRLTVSDMLRLAQANSSISSHLVCQERQIQKDSEDMVCPRKGGPLWEHPGEPAWWLDDI